MMYARSGVLEDWRVSHNGCTVIVPSRDCSTVGNGIQVQQPEEVA